MGIKERVAKLERSRASDENEDHEINKAAAVCVAHEIVRKHPELATEADHALVRENDYISILFQYRGCLEGMVKESMDPTYNCKCARCNRPRKLDVIVNSLRDRRFAGAPAL
jgi:hypothetical protein